LHVLSTPTRTSDGEVVGLIEAFRSTGDRRSVERLLEMHGKILNHLVRRCADSSGEAYEDLLQVGYVGLIKAIRGYDEGSGAKFSSYAYAMIEGELKHHFRDTALVKKPRWARSLYSKVSEATVKLTFELGRPPLVEEIASEVNVALEGIVELMKLFSDTSVVSLDGTEGEESVDLSAIRSVQYESFSLPIEDRIQIERALESLTELQRKVIYLFFYKDLCQTEIGRRLGLSQRKTSRTVASALKALKDSEAMESPESREDVRGWNLE
jgi:RNA polymerase sigma-B factor